MKIGVTALGSGSRGNAFVIHSEAECLLIDAGFSRRELLNRMSGTGVDPNSIKTLLVTHEHTDHVAGMRLFCRDYDIPVCMSGGTADYLRRKQNIAHNVFEFAGGNSFESAGFRITPFQVQHDAVDPVGYILTRGGIQIGIATDLGTLDLLAKTRLGGSDILIIESNYDLDMLRNSERQLHLKRRILGRNGHLDNQATLDAFETLISPRTKLIYLVHVSTECNSYSLVRKNAEAKLRQIGRPDIALEVIEQAEPLETAWL
ncbi:MAG: MBL fold metallo-hydrolase [Lentisphaerae bacterium]|jgi:phosphoribosyl 1,2-cyclic phosphodiesterase|nr:MBL fold metallo-hydrolase [Victivallaceae bacterium]MDD3702813.1 MBL fold metallo-hydrolase [Victivallaceae bacterium]NLK83077.1 MBL fold metallo-hydrolase [Lentisphaerota bacterium]